MDHLVCSQVEFDDDDNDIVTEPSCNKIDMSNIAFVNKRVVTNDNIADNKQYSSSKLQDKDNNILSSLPITS